jgi:hypothetical protein
MQRPLDFLGIQAHYNAFRTRLRQTIINRDAAVAAEVQLYAAMTPYADISDASKAVLSDQTEYRRMLRMTTYHLRLIQTTFMFALQEALATQTSERIQRLRQSPWWTLMGLFSRRTEQDPDPMALIWTRTKSIYNLPATDLGEGSLHSLVYEVYNATTEYDQRLSELARNFGYELTLGINVIDGVDLRYIVQGFRQALDLLFSIANMAHAAARTPRAYESQRNKTVGSKMQHQELPGIRDAAFMQDVSFGNPTRNQAWVMSLDTCVSLEREKAADFAHAYLAADYTKRDIRSPARGMPREINARLLRDVDKSKTPFRAAVERLSVVGLS